jgi:hypothetical protein
MVEYSDVPIPSNPDALARAYHEKTLSISPQTAHELAIPEPTPPEVVTTKVYSFSPSEMRREVQKAHAELAEGVRQHLEKLPELIKEELHVRRGGV